MAESNDSHFHTTHIEPFEDWRFSVDLRGSGDQFQCGLYFQPLDDYDRRPMKEKHGHVFNLRREHLEKVVRTFLTKLQVTNGALAKVDTSMPSNEVVEKERDTLAIKVAGLEHKLAAAREQNRRLTLKADRYKLEFDWHARPPEISNRPSPVSKTLLRRMGVCAYCGVPVTNVEDDEQKRERPKAGGTPGSGVIEHIWPRSKGGTNHDANLTLACLSCNTKKSDYIDPHTWNPTFTAEILRKQLGEWSVGDIAITNQMEGIPNE